MACTSAAPSLTGVPRVAVNVAGLDGQPGAVNVGHATYPFSGVTAGDWACGAGPEECTPPGPAYLSDESEPGWLGSGIRLVPKVAAGAVQVGQRERCAVVGFPELRLGLSGIE